MLGSLCHVSLTAVPSCSSTCQLAGVYRMLVIVGTCLGRCQRWRRLLGVERALCALVMAGHTHLAQSDDGSRMVSGVTLHPSVLALQLERQLEDFTDREPTLALWSRCLRWLWALLVALH